MASAPSGADGEEKENADGPSEFEFLIKKTENNEWITGMAPGSKLEISQVLGSGFKLEENLEGFNYDFPMQNVLLFAAGSGLAPIKSAVESGKLNVDAPGGGGRSCRLYYGERTAEDLCYVDKFAEWEEAGFQVVPVLSQPSEEWVGRSGYIQNALEGSIEIPRNSLVWYERND